MSDKKSHEYRLPHLSCRNGSNEYSTSIEMKEFPKEKEKEKRKSKEENKL